ncbi:MAG: alkylated repair protein [Devosia sp.]|uniref:alpha-ketoglutarate-dependent dioxygenase AlkB n=1 Tax=Devosia sp. TaxID=1871048 RepID=UPI00261E7B92|nr:alpha-ketoglutarate-dependent dioxygenase AlkB [Devosia sp.]MDB5527427.1 alkylated repair protein [Devosia sp.]
MTLDLFGASSFPEGFVYAAEVLSAGEEGWLLAELETLPFQEFDFHGFLGKRRVVSFGWKYDFAAATLRQADAIPDFLLPIRDRATAAIGRNAEGFKQVLVTEYGPGAGIGWHKDKAVFGEVIGVSLAATCTLRLRRRDGEKWQRVSTELAPRSVYLFSGSVRSEWEHSIPPVSETRYSLTFRSLAQGR